MEGYDHEPSGVDGESAKRRSGAPSILGEDLPIADSGHFGQKASSKTVKLGDIEVVVSIHDRIQKSLTKHFSGTDDDWSDIDKQLTLWGRQFQVGQQRLQVSVTIHY